MIIELKTRAASSSNYEIDGKLDPTLSFVRGQTYVFDRDDSGHALYIKEALGSGRIGSYDQGVTNNGATDPTLDLTFFVPLDAPDLLFYQCGAHYSMNGRIEIKSAEAVITSMPEVNIQPSFVNRVLPSLSEKTLIHTEFGKFIFCSTPKSWSTASQSQGIQSDSGQVHLASIRNEKESAVINEALQSVNVGKSGLSEAIDGGGSAYVWLGGTDTAKEGVWNWSDSSSWGYENWGTGSAWDATGQTSEPDNYNEQDYLAVGLESWPKGSPNGSGLGDSGQWNDISGSNLLPSLTRLPEATKRLQIEGGQSLAFDASGSAGLTAKTIVAVLGKDSLNNANLVAAGLALYDSGQSLESVCQIALNAMTVASSQDIVNLL